MSVLNFFKRHQQNLLSLNPVGLETRADVNVATFVTNFIMFEDILEFIIKGDEYENLWGLSHSAVKSLRRCAREARLKDQDSGRIFVLTEANLNEVVLTRISLNQIFKTSPHIDDVVNERIDRLEGVWNNHILNDSGEIDVKKIRHIRNNRQGYPLTMLYTDKSWSINGKYFCLTFGGDRH